VHLINHDKTIMIHLYINPTMHHIPMKPHQSIFIYASCINDNSLIHLHQYTMIRYVYIKGPLIFDIIQSSFGINQFLDIHPLTTINQLSFGINQTINPLTSTVIARFVGKVKKLESRVETGVTGASPPTVTSMGSSFYLGGLVQGRRP
jgi:hypothetical protein